jgi:hypothetical protein
LPFFLACGTTTMLSQKALLITAKLAFEEQEPLHGQMQFATRTRTHTHACRYNMCTCIVISDHPRTSHVKMQKHNSHSTEHWHAAEDHTQHT